MVLLKEDTISTVLHLVSPDGSEHVEDSAEEENAEDSDSDAEVVDPAEDEDLVRSDLRSWWYARTDGMAGLHRGDEGRRRT